MEFEKWMAAVDAAMERLADVSSEDLVDQPYADWHEEGVSPSRAARMALKEEY